MKSIIIKKSHIDHNATPIIIDLLNRNKNEKELELQFEKGEYHFYQEGAYEHFVAVTNNRSCTKKIIFPLVEMDGITINGNGSVFVFHDIATPFYVFKSKNVVIKNIIFDRAFSPVINMRVREKCEEGFWLDIDKEKTPFYIQNGNLVFEREWGKLSTAERKIDLHMKTRHWVQYLFAGDTKDSTDNLPADFMLTDASETIGGVFLKYRNDTQSKCQYEEGTEIYCLADGSVREADVIILSDSENIKIKDVIIRRGLSMGIIGQLCCNVEVEGLKTDCFYHNETPTLTADCMHFVNCSGKLEIHSCNVEYIADDVINIHGIYTSVKEKSQTQLLVKLQHRSQRYFNPYKVRDVLDIISTDTYEVLSQFIVDNSSIVSEDGSLIEINGKFIYGYNDIKKDFWVENPKRMPNVFIHDNTFKNFPSMRVSGAGEIVISENELMHCTSALQSLDLAPYWMESGRIKELVFTKNTLANTIDPAIVIGISGVLDKDAAKIHGRIEISNNDFKEINNKVLKAGGVSNLIILNNSYDTEKEDIILVDGITLSKGDFINEN